LGREQVLVIQIAVSIGGKASECSLVNFKINAEMIGSASFSPPSEGLGEAFGEAY